LRHKQPRIDCCGETVWRERPLGSPAKDASCAISFSQLAISFWNILFPGTLVVATAGAVDSLHWDIGANKNANWRCACVVAWEFWNKPSGQRSGPRMD